MLDLNTGYEELKRQIQYIETHFLDCKDANMTAIYYSTYRNLVGFYMEATGENPCRSSVNKNQYVKYMGRDRLNSLYKKKRENFIANKQNHLHMFYNSYFDVSDMLEDFTDTKYYDHIVSQAEPFFLLDEGLDILYSFFTDCDPQMKSLLEEAKEEKRIYQLPTGCLGKDGCVVYNAVENMSNILFNLSSSPLRLLETIVHEFGHVRDFADYSQRYSPKQTGLYSFQTSYCEVLSTYYQYRFYDYLLENNIYTDAVMLDVLGEFMMAVEVEDDMLLLSMLPDEAIRSWKYAQEKQLMFDAVMSSSLQHDIVFDSNVIDHRIVDFEETVSYSYGTLLSLAMLTDSKLYDNFLANRSGYFNMQTLTDIGFSAEETGKKMVKKCEGYFGKYL